MSEQENQNDVPAVARPWVNLLDRHGWPTILVLGGVMALWHLLSWFEPRATKLIDEHVETVKSLRESSVKQTDILDGINQRQGENTTILKAIHDRVSRGQ